MLDSDSTGLGSKCGDHVDGDDYQRLLADQRLRDELAADQFTGSRYRRFETELVRYAMAVLHGWLRSAHIVKLTAERGFPVHPTSGELDQLYYDGDARDELASMTVAVALPRFREQGLVGGGWRPDLGASLTIYFMGACLNVFPNEFRRWRTQRRLWRQQDHGVIGEPEQVHDPAELAANNQRGTNENTNRLLREYFPKGTDITDDQTYLDLVARELNNRPRRILGYRTPAEVFTGLLASSIATTG